MRLVTGGTAGHRCAMAKPTINDVARLSGVSKKTVSRVINRSPQINPATRAKIEKVIAELDYVPNPQARALALRRNFTLALVHDGSDREVAAAAQDGALQALAGGDHALAVQPLPADPQAAAVALRDFLERHRPAGVVLLPPLSADPALASLCREFGCAVAGVGAAGKADLSADERAGAAAAAGLLVSLGHRRIGFVGGPEEDACAQSRELGYLDAMADHELDRGPALIAGGDWSFASGIEAGALLLQISPRPTAILAASDEMAAGVLHAARAAGLKVPEDLSVMGFGDMPLAARTVPPLATVRWPVAEMARAAAHALTVPLAPPPPGFTCEIVARPSVAPLAG